jgi:hypothetical protein
MVWSAFGVTSFVLQNNANVEGASPARKPKRWCEGHAHSTCNRMCDREDAWIELPGIRRERHTTMRQKTRIISRRSKGSWLQTRPGERCLIRVLVLGDQRRLFGHRSRLKSGNRFYAKGHAQTQAKGARLCRTNMMTSNSAAWPRSSGAPLPVRSIDGERELNLVRVRSAAR